MFKKILSTMLLSSLFVTSANAAVSGRDIADKNLSSDRFSLGVQNAYNQGFSELFGKKVTINVLKSKKTSKVSIKNGTCKDYSMLELLATDTLSKSEQATDSYSAQDIQKITIMTYRIIGATDTARKKLGC